MMRKISEISSDIRKLVLETSYRAGSKSAHIGGALSMVDMLSVIFFKEKNIDNFEFVLSKGHACLALYSTLHKFGIISKKKLLTFETNNSDLPGHPVRNQKLRIRYSTGSLGIGISISTGLALALKKKSIKRKVYSIVGDGECNEGIVWEAAMFGHKYKLNNLCVLIDKNNFQQTGKTSDIMDTSKLSDKWKSFKWKVIEVDGHDHSKLIKAINVKSRMPKVIICKTIKGKGISFFENNNLWHHNILSKDFYKKAIMEL